MAVRRAHDFYPTPEGATLALLERAPLLPHAYVVECCSGDGAMVKPLRAAGCIVLTNDADLAQPSTLHLDARDPRTWRVFSDADAWLDQSPATRWVVTNPPFVYAGEILRQALDFADNVAMLLRLSFLEPCEGRDRLLSERPPTRLIVLPRISFTGDGNTDSVTCAWFVWSRGIAPGIEVVLPPPKHTGIASMFDAADA